MDAIAQTLTMFTTLVALVLSFLAFRREQHVREEALTAQRRAQARLVTGWWTRVSGHDDEDLSLKTYDKSEWPDEVGFRIWIANASGECVYDCVVTTDIKPGPDARLDEGVSTRPFMVLTDHTLLIAPGTLAPRDQTAYLVDPDFASSPGELTIQFRDSAGVKWRRSGGDLLEVEP